MKFFFNKRKDTNPAPEQVITKQSAPAAADNNHNEIAAVIALSLNMYLNQLREYENAIITVQKVMKPYSPWSSKIYGMRQPVTHTPALKPKTK